MTTIQISANVQNLLSDCQSASEFNSIMCENYPNFFKEGTHTATIVSMLSKQFAKTFANYTEASYFLENITIEKEKTYENLVEKFHSENPNIEPTKEDVKETETTKSEDTNDENKATNEDANDEQTNDEKQAFLKRCEVVKGLLQTEKNADLVKAIALKHSPKYATNQKSTIGSKIKELFIELTQLGFSKPQIFDLKIIGIKGTALSPASVSDTYKIATGERVRANEPKNIGGEAKERKTKTKEVSEVKDTKKLPTHGDICQRIVFLKERISKDLQELRTLPIVFETLYNLDVQKQEVQAKEDAKKVLSNIVASGFTKEQLLAMLSAM